MKKDNLIPSPEDLKKGIQHQHRRLTYQIVSKFETAKRESKLSDADICKALNMSRQTVINIRTGKCFSIDSLIALCELMDMELTIRSKPGKGVFHE